jgi:hypothetical protein
MPGIGFEASEELIRLRNCTAPAERHFFCEMDGSGIHITRARLQRWNTYGELLGLRGRLAGDPARSLMIVSTDVHLRRIALVIDRIFHGVPMKVLYCPVPESYGSLRKEKWWTRSADRRFVLKEAVKLAGYRVILSLPDWAVRRLMRLKE